MRFYRSQFWRLQKPAAGGIGSIAGFIGHNFGDYKNLFHSDSLVLDVLSVTILETTKTGVSAGIVAGGFYRSQFWRLQKPSEYHPLMENRFYRSQFWRLQKLRLSQLEHQDCFIGHNFGDYKNLKWYQLMTP